MLIVGQPIHETNQHGGQVNIAFDNLGRLLTSNQTSNGASAQRQFVYDRWGNRTAVYDATSGGNPIQNLTLEQSNSIPTT